jgi:Ca-activated chloride channel family protein
MNKKSPARRRIWLGRVGIFLLLIFGLMVGTMLNPGFWFTADQRGDWLFRHGKFEQAAKIFSDPLSQGVALYRAGDFLPASKAFIRVRDAAGAFDQGNALLMHGAYDQAIAAFDRALGLHPGWKKAEGNRALAVIRRDRLQIKGGNMTEGMEEGNETVINLNAKRDRSSPDSAVDDKLSDAELQATWLRRVQTTPGDFLRVKFSYQAKEQAQKAKAANP